MTDWSPAYEDREVLNTPKDKNRPENAGMPRHSKGRKWGHPPKRPVVWNVEPPAEFDPPPVWGMFPMGFLDLALRHLACSPGEVLHVCSGGLSRQDVRGGTRVDVSRTSRPDVVGDGQRLPFSDSSFSGVLIDPPYSVEYAKSLYGCDYPRPSALLREASRVVRPCGRVGFVHYIIPMPPSGLSILRILALTVGCGYRIRAFTVFEKDQKGLGL